MAQVAAKQILRLIDGFVRVNSFAGSGASNNVTTAITTALSTASNTGGSVPVQAATATASGIVVLTGKNRVAIYASSTKLPLVDASGNEVYGRLTEATGVYTVTYFSLVAGTETAYTLPSTNIDFEFTYRFNFADLPADFATGVVARNVSDDPQSALAALFTEELRNPTALNTIAALSFAPNPAASLVLVVNGQECSTLDGSFTVAGTAVTWVAGTAGFNLETTDKVVARYRR